MKRYYIATERNKIIQRTSVTREAFKEMLYVCKLQKLEFREEDNGIEYWLIIKIN